MMAPAALLIAILNLGESSLESLSPIHIIIATIVVLCIKSNDLPDSYSRCLSCHSNVANKKIKWPRSMPSLTLRGQAREEQVSRTS